MINKINNKWGYLFALSIIWGSSFILIKKGLIGLSPLQLGSLRIVFSSIIIFIIGFKFIKKIDKNKWKWIAVSGFLGTFFPAFLFAYAETQIDSAVASILNSLVPMNTVLIGFAIFKISTTKIQTIGVLIGFIGTISLIISEGFSCSFGKKPLTINTIPQTAITAPTAFFTFKIIRGVSCF